MKLNSILKTSDKGITTFIECELCDFAMRLFVRHDEDLQAAIDALHCPLCKRGKINEVPSDRKTD